MFWPCVYVVDIIIIARRLLEEQDRRAKQNILWTYNVESERILKYLYQ